MKIEKAHVWFVLLAFIVCFNSCKKDVSNNETNITGIIVEYGSNKPIAGSTVILSRADRDAFLAQAYFAHKTTTSDANGKYSFTFDYEDAFKYLLTATNGIHSQSENYSIKRGKNSINIIQYAPGYLKLHIKNVNPFDANDRISIFFSEFYGISTDTVIYNKLESKNQSIYYWTTKNGIDSTHVLNVYLPPFDTASYDINY